MALPKVADARKLSDEELTAEILTAKQKLFELRLQKATRRLEKTHEFKHIRHWIAQLLTVEHERQVAAEPIDAAESAEPFSAAADEPADAAADEISDAAAEDIVEETPLEEE
ncbi:MAG: 50S ribosomal protein L29 [Cyanobacteria bacterium P01_G01_bin.54]